MQHVRDEELEEVFAHHEQRAPEDHADQAGHDEQAHVVRGEGLDLVHVAHQPQLGQEAWWGAGGDVR